MHLEKLPNGTWRAAVSVAGTRRSVTRRTKGEARFAGAELTIEMGGRPAEGTSTVGELVAGHLAQTQAVWSPTTHDDMRRVADRLPDKFTDRPVRSITPAVLAGLYRQLEREGWSPHRIKRAHTLLSVAFKTAVIYGWLKANPCRDVSPPTPPKADVHAPDVTAIQTLLRHAGTLELFLLVAHCTGARRGEIVALKWDDIDLERGQIRIIRSLAQQVGGNAVAPDLMAALTVNKRVRCLHVTAFRFAVPVRPLRRPKALYLNTAVGGELLEPAKQFAETVDLVEHGLQLLGFVRHRPPPTRRPIEYPAVVIPCSHQMPLPGWRFRYARCDSAVTRRTRSRS